MIKKEDDEEKTSFFGKMKTLFSEAKSHVEETIKEINFPEIKQTLSDQSKVAAIAFKEFGNDISRDFKVFSS